jgi:hypothetical protein
VIKKNTGPEFANPRHHEEPDIEKKDGEKGEDKTKSLESSSAKGAEYLNEILTELNDSLKYVTKNPGNVSRNEIQVRSRINSKSKPLTSCRLCETVLECLYGSMRELSSYIQNRYCVCKH